MFIVSRQLTSLLSRLSRSRRIISRHWFRSVSSLNFLPLGHLNFTVRSRHSLSEVFFAENSWGRLESSTFLLGADPKLSGEGVFNGIYYCPLGFRVACTCISLCTVLFILTSWLRASNLSIVNRKMNFLHTSYKY